MRLLGQLSIDQGTTIIMVTHDSQVASRAERMLFLNDGKLLKKEKEPSLGRKPSCIPIVDEKPNQKTPSVPVVAKSYEPTTIKMTKQQGYPTLEPPQTPKANPIASILLVTIILASLFAGGVLGYMISRSTFIQDLNMLEDQLSTIQDQISRRIFNSYS